MLARYSGRVPSPDRGLLRVARTGAIAFCIVGLSLLAHVLAGGPVPAPGILLVALAAAGAYAGALTRDRLGLFEIVAALGAGQVLLHLAFMLGGGGHHGGVEMMLAHTLATLVIALGLAHGERAAWSLWCWLGPRPTLRAVAPGEVPEPPDRPVEVARARASTAWIGTTVMWRGPPVG